jgi:hypothetical protein
VLGGGTGGSLCVFHQGKLQKHQAFEAEVQANSGAIVKLDETGNLMISEGHFASETIRVSLNSAWWEWPHMVEGGLWVQACMSI